MRQTQVQHQAPYLPNPSWHPHSLRSSRGQMASNLQPDYRAWNGPDRERRHKSPSHQCPLHPGPQQEQQRSKPLLEWQHLRIFHRSKRSPASASRPQEMEWVGSDRIKCLIPDTVASREEGHCKICTDSYDHLYRECPEEDLSPVHALETAAIK